MVKERIDVHGHYFPPAYQQLLKRHHMDLLDGVAGPDWSLQRQWEYMVQLNISFSTLSLSSPHLHLGDRVEAAETARACNEYGAELTRKYPNRLAALASLPLPEIEDSIREIRYCREVLGLRGFALLTNFRGVYLGSKTLEPVMEELNREPTLLTIHPTQPPQPPVGAAEELPSPVMEYFIETTRAVVNLMLKGTLRRYPNLHFVVPHGGAFLTVLSDRLFRLGSVLLKDNDLDIPGDLARLYYDLAGFSMPKQFNLLRTVTDDSHLLYGSDSPFTNLSVCGRLAKEMDTKLDADLAEQIYRKNPQALFQKTGFNWRDE